MHRLFEVLAQTGRRYVWKSPLPLAVVLLCAGCDTVVVQTAPNPTTPRRLSKADQTEPRQIELFFDGTSNDWKARTNVRRRYEMVAWAEDPSFPCCYFEGVGVDSMVDRALGLGMKARILKAYAFLATNWRKADKSVGRRKDDKIFIYGFSRGAFEARVLVGLMAHCGLPDASGVRMDSQQLSTAVEEVWDFCRKSLKDPKDEHPADYWGTWLANNRDKTARKFAGRWSFNNPRISMLALWDTVPGLPLTKLDPYGNSDPDKPQRYKVRPYPNVQVIAQALSLDECRSKFTPLLVGPPLDPGRTHVHEVWFPGVHSDVGGGYSDSNDLSGKSFNWVLAVMNEEGIATRAIDKRFANTPDPAYSDAAGILHHPEKVFPNNIGSREERRLVPKGSMIDISVFTRARLADPKDLPLEIEGTSPTGKLYSPQIPVGVGGKKEHTVEITAQGSPEQMLGSWLKVHQAKAVTPIKGQPLPTSQMEVQLIKPAEAKP